MGGAVRGFAGTSGGAAIGGAAPGAVDGEAAEGVAADDGTDGVAADGVAAAAGGVAADGVAADEVAAGGVAAGGVAAARTLREAAGADGPGAADGAPTRGPADEARSAALRDGTAAPDADSARAGAGNVTIVHSATSDPSATARIP
jgi:hypothetical protein